MLMSPIRNKIEIQNNKHKKKNKEWNLSILKIFHYRHQNFTSKTAIKDKVFKNATQNCVCAEGQREFVLNNLLIFSYVNVSYLGIN